MVLGNIVFKQIEFSLQMKKMRTVQHSGFQGFTTLQLFTEEK